MLVDGQHGNELRESRAQCLCGWFWWSEFLVQQDTCDWREELSVQFGNGGSMQAGWEVMEGRIPGRQGITLAEL